MTAIPGFTDEHGYFLSPEHAATHATVVQGGFTTPAREARRMVKDGGRGAEIGREWLLSRGLPIDGDDEPSQDWQQPDVAAMLAPVSETDLNPQMSPLARPAPAAVDLDGTDAAAWFLQLTESNRIIEMHTGIRGRAIERIQEAMGDATEARVGGRPVVTWKAARPSKRLDRKLLEADLGADVVAAKYLREAAASRPFKVLPLDGA